MINIDKIGKNGKNEIYVAIGQRFKKILAKKGITRKKLTEIISKFNNGKHASISVIDNYCSGASLISSDVLLVLGNQLGISADEILFGEADEDNAKSVNQNYPDRKPTEHEIIDSISTLQEAYGHEIYKKIEDKIAIVIPNQDLQNRLLDMYDVQRVIDRNKGDYKKVYEFISHMTPRSLHRKDD